MMNRNILVTGGAGYIGSHACKRLAVAGYTPITVDCMVNGNPWAVKYGPLEKGDIGDRQFLESVFAQYTPTAVMHFAAYAYVGESTRAPLRYYENNVAATVTLLQTMLAHKCNRIIFSSTCATYGIPAGGIIQEGDPQVPISPYGHSKLMIEQILKDTHAAHGLNYAILRYFNAAGADPELEIGEHHTPETHLIPRAILAALGEIPALGIFGTDHPTLDGTAVRDYVHVCDLADAHLLVLKEMISKNENFEFNLGSSNGYSVKEVVNAIEKHSGVTMPIRDEPPRAGDPPTLRANSSPTIYEKLGWTPRMSSLDAIVKTAYNWHQTFLKRTN